MNQLTSLGQVEKEMELRIELLSIPYGCATDRMSHSLVNLEKIFS